MIQGVFVAAYGSPRAQRVSHQADQTWPWQQLAQCGGSMNEVGLSGRRPSRWSWVART